MRTRSAGAQKAATPKKTQPPRKSPARKVSPVKSKPAKNDERSAAATFASSDPKPGQRSADATPEAEVLLGSNSVEKKTSGGTGTSASPRGISKQPPKSGQTLNTEIEKFSENKEEMEMKNPESLRKQESGFKKAGEPAMEGQTRMEIEEPVVVNLGVSEEEKDVKEVETAGKPEENTEEWEKENSENIVVAELAENEEQHYLNEAAGIEEHLEEDLENVHCKEVPKTGPGEVKGNQNDELQREHAEIEQNAFGGDEAYEDYGDSIDFEDHEEEIPEDDVEEPSEETRALEEEHKELTAAAKERKIKKEHEIFVGGLDRDATKEDVRNVFENIGEVVEVRMHKNLSTKKNKGFAFVQFASKENTKRALLEMKNPVIRGKRCGIAASEDNDTLFLGNICNTWTKEAIGKKLKDYGVEGVENITLVPDVQHEGLSRGFAFLEFSCHSDAMLAYKRLQKPDVILGHPERTAKVAFAEPLREPDPEVMAKVKTVFLDGLPPHWDEECVRDQLKDYGEIVRVVLARNMPTAKRKDFGFVDFSTHDEAVSCIYGVNKTELSDRNSKTKVKARLSNPLPKTQAVKGGMCGGFRIHHGGTGTFARLGRGFGRARLQFNRPDFHHSRSVDRHEWGQISRMRPDEHGFDRRYPDHCGGQTARRGGRRGPYRGGYHVQGRGFTITGPSRSNINRPWYDAPDRGPREHSFSTREPFPLEEPFDRPFGGRQYDDPYIYDEAMHGMRRAFYTTHQDPDYMEPRRVRPRLDYTDPTISFRNSLYHDTYGARGDYYPRDCYGSNYGSYSHSYGGGQPYRGGRGSYY